MNETLSEEMARRKKAVFDAMSKRRQNHILKKGYDKWDPFQDPKDPIDIRRDETRRTIQMLVMDFLKTLPESDYSSAFRGGVFEIAMGMVNKDDRYVGMYAFSCWYRDELKRAGRKP